MQTHRILRMSETTKLTGLSNSTIDRLEKNGDFPRRRRIGVRAVGWIESEVHAWISNRSKKLKRKNQEVTDGRL